MKQQGRAHRSRRGETFRPQVQNPENHWNRFQLFEENCRQADGDGRGVEDKNDIESAPAIKRRAEAGEKGGREIVQGKLPRLPLSSGNQGKTGNLYPLIFLKAALENTVTVIKSSMRIIRHTGKNRNHMAPLL